MVVTTIARHILDDEIDLVSTDVIESACTLPVEQQLSPKVDPCEYRTPAGARAEDHRGL